MLSNVRETYGEAKYLDPAHPSIGAACKAVDRVANEFREEALSATPKAKVTEKPFVPLLVPQQPDAPVA